MVPLLTVFADLMGILGGAVISASMLDISFGAYFGRTQTALSLTAIALVFALLKVSPTPVCVMDEVDAMLDEANVGRFRDLLVDLSKDTQFIIITHNRNTVQAADVIYGITMGRDSASQVISLRLDQVTDEMLSRG